MKNLALLCTALFLAACVTETVEDEPVVYGRITTTKPAKYKKPKPAKHTEETVFEVERAPNQ